MKRLLPLVLLLAGIALLARQLPSACSLELPDQPWTEVCWSTSTGRLSRLERPQQIALLVDFLAARRQNWRPGVPAEPPTWWVDFRAPRATATFGLNECGEDARLVCQGMTLRLSQGEQRQLFGLLAERGPRKFPSDDFWVCRMYKPNPAPRSLDIHVEPPEDGTSLRRAPRHI